MLTTTHSESSIHAPELGQFIEIHGAITSGDHETLERIKAKSKNLDSFLEDVHRSIGYGSFVLGVAGGKELTNHAALWMMPIVTRDGYSPPKTNCFENQQMLHSWFGRYQSLHTLSSLLPIEAFTGINPTETYTLLQVILRMQPEGKPVFGEEINVQVMPQELGFPRLSFMVGAVARMNELPEIPDSLDFALQSRIETTLQFQGAQAKEMLVGKGVRIGAPTAFKEALTDGWLLWLEEIDKVQKITAWTMDTLAEGVLALTFSFQSKASGSKGVISFPLQQWQLGAAGIERIIDWCKRWPLEHALEVDSPSGLRLS